MANFFPSWTNWLPLKLLVIVLVLGAVVTGGIWYYFTPKYTNVGYMPEQPAPFSHAIHVEQLGMDCRYCHTHVEVAAHSNVPDTQTCMACHSQIKAQSPKLAAVRASWETGTPVEWIRIHKAPDYVYFNHAVHVNRGVSCVECHGRIDQQVVVGQQKSLNMSFCLDCHRNPEQALRPVDKVYDLGFKAASPAQQTAAGTKFVHDWKVNPPQSCSGCHR